jgi:four helix bundle protein
MTYKDLNVYKRAYKVALDLHRFLDGNKKIESEWNNRIREFSREVMANIAESFAQRTPRAKRFFNFKARDSIRNLQMDLDFLHDVNLLPQEEYQLFYTEYEVCSKQLFKLNQSILEQSTQEKDQTSSAVKAKKKVAVAA